MKNISKIHNTKKLYFVYFIVLLIFSTFINQYYGYIGVYPIDTFLFFDTGYKTSKGYFPFKDFWVVTGPLLDLIQSVFLHYFQEKKNFFWQIHLFV